MENGIPYQTALVRLRFLCNNWPCGLENFGMAAPLNTTWRTEILSRRNLKADNKTADPDAQLVKLAASGDNGAFQTLVQKHQRTVYGIVSRMLRERDETDDLVQDIFIRAFRNLDRFRGDSLFSTWLHSIAVNTTLKHLKRRKTRLTVSLDDPDMGIGDSIPASTSDPGDEAQSAVLKENIRRQVEGLPDKHKLVIVLYYFEEYSCEEIAKILGCSVGTVWSRLHYACKKLRAPLGWLNEGNEE